MALRILASSPDPDLLTRQDTLWLPVASSIDIAAKQDADPAAERLVSALEAKDALRRSFNKDFLAGSDATDPASVGVWGALKGSFLTIIVTMLLAFPIGVLAAVYLEEFARQMIHAEELHAADVDKMLRKPGELALSSTAPSAAESG